MPTTTACLWFDSQGEQAAQFYTSIFPNSSIGAITRYGPDAHGPEGSVMTVAFVLDGQPYIALNGGPLFTFSEAISFEVGCESQEEVDHYWDRLSDGGQQGPCGWLKDRYGFSWQVCPTVLEDLVTDADEGRRNRAMTAMLGMSKLDIAALEAAADGR